MATCTTRSICISLLFFVVAASAAPPSLHSRQLSSKHHPDSEVPWCMKGGIMSTAPDSSVVLWSGKGHDKHVAPHGSSLLSSFWVLNTISPHNAKWEEVSWRKFPQHAHPDGRWKSSGDVIGDYFFMFGGDDGHSFLNDIWGLDLNKVLAANVPNRDEVETPTLSWINPQLGGVLPHQRRGHTLTALPLSRSVLLVGGRKKHEVCLQDAWLLTLPDEEVMASNASWAATSWREVDALPGQCRWGHSATLATDPITKSEIVAVFGGRMQDLDSQKFIYSNDLWFFSPTNGGSGQWSEAETVGGVVPEKRDHHSMVFDGTSHSIIVFAGRTSQSMGKAALNDVWEYSLLTQSWRELRPLGRKPETRYLHMAAWSEGSMIVFAGEHIEPNNKLKRDHKLNDVWSYSVAENVWNQLTVDNCDGLMVIPAERGDMRLLAGSMLVFGVLFAAVLILGNHYVGVGGGDHPCDYWRPRLRARPPSQNQRVEMADLSTRAALDTQTGYQSLSQL